MKTLLSQCLIKVEKKTAPSVRTNTDDCIESSDVSLHKKTMARTITETIESPDKMICSQVIN